MNKYLILAAVVCVCVGAAKCGFVVEESNGEKYYYDFSGFGELSLDSDGCNYKLNLCEGVSDGCSKKSAVCMRNREGEYSTLGMLSTREVVTVGGEEPGQGAVVLFGDGDSCPGSYYTSTILVLCDPNEPGQIITVLPDECDYSFQIVSKLGCAKPATPSEIEGDGSDEGSDKGEVFATVVLVLLLVAVVVYFALGAVWQKVRHDPQSFSEYIIHRDFWVGLPGLVVDGCKFIGHGFRKGDYTAV